MDKAEAESAVLVVDDDDGLRATISDFLTLEGYRVRMASGVGHAREMIAREVPDLVLLDITMPGGSGLGLAAELHQTALAPVIILSGKGSLVDRVVGLEVGADDYLAKPFDLRELLARVRAVLRRTRRSGTTHPATPASREARFDVFILSPSRRQVTTVNGQDIVLTGAEYNLLAALVDHPHRVMSRDAIADLIRKDDWDAFDRSIDTLVSRLRRKLASHTDGAHLVQTVRGEGYVLASNVTWSGQAG